MSAELVQYDVHGHVCVITVNRPAVRNAQSRLLLDALDMQFIRADNDDEVRVIVLFAAGEHFSAGHDLGSTQELEDRKLRPLQDGVRSKYIHSHREFVEKSSRWRNLKKPTIAGVQGYCIFGGWILASAMDVVFAAENAMFLASNFQYFTVPWDIHPRKAKEILFESRFINSKEAMDLGLVNQVFQNAQLQDEVLAYAARIATNDPFQLQMIKLAVNQMQDTQGFGAHMTSAHLMHMLSSLGETDSDYALAKPDGKQRPMVAQAFENYQRRQSQQK